MSPLINWLQVLHNQHLEVKVSSRICLGNYVGWTSLLPEHLSAVRVLGWRGVVSRFRNGIKGVACVQTFVLFRNAIKTSCLQKVVYRSQCCSGASGLIVKTSKWQKL